jgi:hypothetical protein
MSLITLFSPNLGRTVKMGRVAPEPGAQKLQLASYATATPISVPLTVDYTKKANAVLANTYLNELLGCCVIAAGYHIVGVWTGNADNLFTASPKQIIADYSAVGHYNPEIPSTDQGAIEQDAFNYWTKTGFANGTKLAGWAAVNATRMSDVMAAIYLFENAILGMQLPDAWIHPLPSASGFVWDVAGEPGPKNGHCVMATGYTQQGVQIDTWGVRGIITWAALAKYGTTQASGEMYTLLSPDQLAKATQKAPNGVAWPDLIASFSKMGGKVSTLSGQAPTPSTPTPAGPAPTPTRPAPTPAKPAPTPARPVLVTPPLSSIVSPNVGLYLAGGIAAVGLLTLLGRSGASSHTSTSLGPAL